MPTTEVADGFPSDDGSCSRLMHAQRRLSQLLRQVARGALDWQLRSEVLDEAARIVDGVVLLVDLSSVTPVLQSTLPDCPGARWEPWVAQLRAAPPDSPFVDRRTVTLRIPGTSERLLVRAPRPISVVDLFLLEPLAELLALLRLNELHEVQDYLRAREDSATGLPNGLALSEVLARRERRAAGPDSDVLLLRVRVLDHDDQGLLGDAVLRAAAGVRDATRDEDLVAHLGGATFAVLCNDVPADEGARVAARLSEHLQERLSELSLGLRAEVGILPPADGLGGVPRPRSG